MVYLCFSSLQRSSVFFLNTVKNQQKKITNLQEKQGKSNFTGKIVILLGPICQRISVFFQQDLFFYSLFLNYGQKLLNYRK